MEFTIAHLVDSISFLGKSERPRKKKNQASETSSISSRSSFDQNEKSKVWTMEEEELFRGLLKKYGTDFNFFKPFFPKKSKNQIKVLPASFRTNTSRSSSRRRRKARERTPNCRRWPSSSNRMSLRKTSTTDFEWRDNPHHNPTPHSLLISYMFDKTNTGRPLVDILEYFLAAFEGSVGVDLRGIFPQLPRVE